MDKIEYANSLSNGDLVDVINMIAPRLMVWEKQNGISHLTEIESACLNGAAVQLNPMRDDEPERPKPITREFLYGVLAGMFHQDTWHCSKTEDGLVEVRFYVSN